MSDSDKTEYDTDGSLKRIPTDNLLKNLKNIINSYNLFEMYNDALMHNKQNINGLFEVAMSTYYYLLTVRPQSKSIPDLSIMISKLESKLKNDEIILIKSQYLYFVYYLSSINLDCKTSEDETTYLHMYA